MAEPKKKEAHTETVSKEHTAKVPAVQALAGALVLGGRKFTVVKQVTLPILKQKSGEIVAFKIEQEMSIETSKEKKRDGTEGEEKQLGVLTVTELTTGNRFTYVCNAILRDRLVKGYPRDKDGVPGYVGKCFAVKKLETLEGKRYKDVNVLEIADDGEVA